MFDKTNWLSKAKPSRRDFLARSVVATSAALAIGPVIGRSALARSNDQIRIALVGCGGRGTGAVHNALNTKANVKLVAMADAFDQKLTSSLKQLESLHPEKVDVPKERQFLGLDAYQKVLDRHTDMVILATPPGFRPMHFEAAVAAGKHVFMEKPIAVDAPGYRQVKATGGEARKKGLLVAIGHHLRHCSNHQKVIRQIHDGLLGELQYTRAYFNSSGIWNRVRQPGMTEMQYQTNNWYHFVWLGGDHIVEQHVHGIDVCNWFAQGHPVEAIGMGGRQVRASKGIGEIFDHHCVQYTYANGLRSFSECRQIPGCWPSFTHHAHGTKGYASFEGNDVVTIHLKGKKPQRLKSIAAGHQPEWDDLMPALTAGQPYNEVDTGADSTMTAILGRMATYSGKLVKWDEAVESKLTYLPDRIAWDAEPKSKPGPDGVYPCAIPGVTRAV